MDVNNSKTSSDNPSTQLANNASAPCDWQRALGISQKVDNFGGKNNSDVASSRCNSQTRLVTKSTRLSLQSDDDLGFCFAFEDIYQLTFFNRWLQCCRL